MSLLRQADPVGRPEPLLLAPGGMPSEGGTYYDARQGRYVTRGGDINGYEAASNNWVNSVDWVGWRRPPWTPSASTPTPS